MKKICIILASLLFALGAAAQNPTAYFMEGSTFRSQFNPAFAPLRGYVNIPGLGGIQVGTSGNLSIDNILYPRGGNLVTLLDSSVSASEALGNLSANNLLGIDARINVIGFGAFTRNHKNFWSFDINVRTNADAHLPYSLFEFLKLGKENNIRDINIMANGFVEAGFNYSFPLLGKLLKDKLYIGVRAKFLAGVARGRVYYDHLNVSLDEDRWNVQAAGGMDVTMAGLKANTQVDDAGNETFRFDDLDLGTPLPPAGYGFAIDLGATYDILPNLQASLAVTDLGAIWWGEKHNIKGKSVKEMEFTGVTISDAGSTPQPDFDLDILEFIPEAPSSIKQSIYSSLNAGLEYEVWRHKIGIGLLYTARFREFQTLHNVTGSVNFHPVRWFTLTGSYSVIDNRGSAVGLALNLNPNWINFYVATDIVTVKHTAKYFIPVQQSTMNITLGLGIPIGKRSHRIAAYVYDKDKR